MLPFATLLKNERLPAVVVDLDAFDRNLAKLRAISNACGKKLRIATKSIRIPELIERVIRSGPPFEGLMCYSAEEVEFLASRGLDDLLLAYPTVQSSDLECLKRLHDSGRTVRMVVDSRKHFEALAEIFHSSARPFEVLLEVDLSLRLFGGFVHLGVRRSPLRTPAQVADLLEQMGREFPRIPIVGVLGYEAQVAGLGDRNPFRPLLNPVKSWIRSISVRIAARTRSFIAEVFRAQGTPMKIFNGGGTGSLDFAARETGLTELTAGSALLSPHLFDYYSNIRFEPAAFFALQAVRSSDPGYITCQGGGYIASGEPGWDKVPRPYWPPRSRLVSMEGCGEVQTPVHLSQVANAALGSAIIFRHAKAGELAERFNEYLLVSEGRIVSRAKTYRGMGFCFF